MPHSIAALNQLVLMALPTGFGNQAVTHGLRRNAAEVAVRTFQNPRKTEISPNWITMSPRRASYASGILPVHLQRNVRRNFHLVRDSHGLTA